MAEQLPGWVERRMQIVEEEINLVGPLKA